MSTDKRLTIKNLLIWIVILVVVSFLFYYYENKQKLKYEIWDYRTLSFSTSPMVIYGDNLYFSGKKNHLYSLSKKGILNWVLDLECPLDSKLIVSNEYILIRTSAAYQTFYPDVVKNCQNPELIHVVNRLSGELINVVKSKTSTFSYTIDDGDIIYSTGTELYEYSDKNHNPIIKFDMGDIRLGGFNSIFHIEKNTIYMKNMYQDVFALNLHTHKLKWRFTSDWNFKEKDTVDAYEGSRSLIYDDGVIYTSNKVQHSSAADIYAFDAESGVILGHYRIDAGTSPGLLSASDKHIYISSNDSRIYELSKRNLYPVWHVPTRGRALGALVPYNGVVYVGTQASEIIGLDEETGERVYRYRANHAVPGTPAIEDGIIYFATNGGSIHAVRLPEALSKP